MTPVRKMDHKIVDLHDFDLYKLTRKIADLFFDPLGNTDKELVERLRNDSMNPFYHQTASGFFLELYEGSPTRLWTPWGFYSCWCGGGVSFDWRTTLPSFLERFSAALYQEQFDTGVMGWVGPVYALHSLDGEPLPEPIDLDRAGYIPYARVRPILKELTARYRSEVVL